MSIKQPYLLLPLLIIFFNLLSHSCNTKSSNSAEQAMTKQMIMVYAAASVTDVLNEITKAFEAEYHIKVQTNLASSGTLARQIEQGAMPDIYLSASKKWADYVAEQSNIANENIAEIAKNELVLIAPINSSIVKQMIDSSMALPQMLKNNRLSIGDPAHVPAGKYAKQALEYFGWYDELDHMTLPAKDVRSALMVVELAETPLGIVYKTDAMKSDKVKIVGSFPEKSHKPIVYVAEIVKNNDASKKFIAFLNSEKTAEIWAKYGFSK